MFKRTRLKNLTVLGDKGYDSEPLPQIAKDNQLTLFAPLRDRARRKIKGWNRRQCAKGHPQYGPRSKVESIIRSLKAKYVKQLRSKKPYMKKREIGWMILAYDLDKMTKAVIRQLCQMYHMLIPDTAARP